MMTGQLAERNFAARLAPKKEAPTLGEELREVFRYIFNQPERRLRGTDFVWSYEELADDVPD